MSVQETNGYLDVENATLRSSKVEVTSNLGIANTNPQHAFSVGSNLFIDTESSNVLTIKGNVLTEGVKVGLIEIIPSYDFAAVSNVGNVTQSTIQFSNATTAFVTTANIEVGTANLFVDTVTGRVGIGKTDPGAALDVVGDVNATGSLTVSKDIESTNSFITERVLFKETWPNGHNSLIGDLGTWVVTNANQQSNPSITTTPDGYTHVSINGDDSANGEFVSPAFDLSDYAIVDGTLQADDKRKTTTRVFMKFWLGTRQLDASGEVVQVQFSPDNGSTWYTVATSQDRNNTDRFTMVSADLSPYILETSTNAKIRFYMPWTVAGGDYMRIGRIWIHESDVPTNLGGMWLGAGGNIGIGTTSPARPLEIARGGGGAIINLKRTDTGTGQGGLAFVNSFSNVSASITASRSGTEGGELRFYTAPDDTTQTSDNPYLIPERMRIDRDGNVGIGTDNPLGKLYIAADYDHTLQRPSTNSNHYLVLSKTGAQVVDEGPGISFCGSYNASSDFQDVMAEIRGVCDTGGGRRGRLEFWTSSSNGVNDVDTQAMTIKNNGNVGIGTDDPRSYQLAVPGRVCLGQLGLVHRNGSSTSLKQVSHSNGSDRVFQFKLNSISSWTPGFFKMKVAVVNNNGSSGFAWGWEAGFKVLNNNNSMDLMSTISGSDPGSSWFSRSWDGTTRVLTLTAKDAARTYIVAECEVLFYGGIQDD
jgi:hypothetical protein